MKLFKAIATAAVICTSFIAPNSAEARNGWVEAGCGTNSRGQGCIYYRYLSRSGPFVKVESRSTFPSKGAKEEVMHEEIDCNGWKSRARYKWADTGWDSWDSWVDILPGTIADGGARKVC